MCALYIVSFVSFFFADFPPQPGCLEPRARHIYLFRHTRFALTHPLHRHRRPHRRRPRPFPRRPPPRPTPHSPPPPRLPPPLLLLRHLLTLELRLDGVSSGTPGLTLTTATPAAARRLRRLTQQAAGRRRLATRYRRALLVRGRRGDAAGRRRRRRRRKGHLAGREVLEQTEGGRTRVNKAVAARQ